MSARSILMLLLFGMVTGDGCIVTVTRNAYDSCNAGDSCEYGTSCQSSNYTRSGAPGNLCTITCTDTAQCPVPLSGAVALCVIVAPSSTGKCYYTCPSGSSFSCPGSTYCNSIPNSTINICVP